LPGSSVVLGTGWPRFGGDYGAFNDLVKRLLVPLLSVLQINYSSPQYPHTNRLYVEISQTMSHTNTPSMTVQNLEAAFAGESMAHIKYR
jgi:hypothetical protein